MNHDTIASSFISKWEKSCREYDKWEKDHKCKQLEDYYEGRQWMSAPEGIEPYVFNLFASTLDAKLPTIIINEPRMTLRPKPKAYTSDFDLESLTKQINVRMNAVNTFLADPDNQVQELQELVLLDSMFRFGVVEVGYSADWTLNPKVHRPAYKIQGNVNDPQTDRPKMQPPSELPENEKIYVRHIPACDVRINLNSTWVTEQNDWIGYREFFQLRDLLAIPAYRRIIEETGAAVDYSDILGSSYTTDEKESCQVECLKIFSIRDKAIYFISKVHGVVLLVSPLARLPLFILRHSKPGRKKNWYPIPPAINWKSPQDEYNSSKETLRIARKRALPKLIVAGNAFNDPIEADKFFSDMPYEVIKSSSPDISGAYSFAQPPPMTADVINAMQTSRDDFNVISGTTFEQQGVASDQTATQSRIIEGRLQLKEQALLTRHKTWFKQVVREISLQQGYRLTKAFWMRMTTDEELLGLVEVQGFKWRLVDPIMDFKEDMDIEVDIDVTSGSILELEAQKNATLEFLAVVTQYPIFATSPVAIRQLASMMNIKNEVIINQMQQSALLTQMSQQQSADAAGMQPGGAMTQRTVAKATPNDNEKITNQLENQVGLPQ